jgi:MFS family permease
MFGALSDRIGRKPSIIWGYALTLVLLFPMFWIIGAAGDPALAVNGVPTPENIAKMVGALLVLMCLSGMTYGPVAALLSEMFPPRIRYSSMSIPYHIGAGYLGGFLPLIASYINARTGDAYAGLWYTWGIVAFGLVVALWGLAGGKPRDFGDDAA